MAVQYQNKVILARDVKVTRGLAGSVYGCRIFLEIVRYGNFLNRIGITFLRVKVSHGCFLENVILL